MSIKDLINQVEADMDLTIAIHSYLENTVQKREPDGMFHASSAGECPRSIYYYQTSAPYTPSDGPSIMRMDLGTDAHTRMQNYLNNMGILVEEEKPVKFTVASPAPKIVICGSCDAIIEFEGTKVWEYKTTISWNFKKVKESGEPLSGHYEQWCCYSQGLKIREGIITYMNKDTQELWHIPVQFDKAKYDKVVEKFKLVQTHIKLGMPPDRPVRGMSDKLCNFCNYKEECWKRNKG